MSDAFPQGAEGNLSTPIRSSRAFSRVAKYATFKALILAITVGIGLYLTILVVNLGGYVDRILYSDVADQVDGLVRSGALRGLPYERAEDLIWTTTWVAEETRGLHVPFMLRTWHWFIRSLSLDWGDGPIAFFASAGNYIHLFAEYQTDLLEQFPYTMLLVGSATFLLFFTSVSLALGLSRRRWGKFMNWLIVVFSSATSIPAWIHGLILIFFLVSLTRLFPFPHSLGYISAKDMTPEILWGVVKSAILPTLALFASLFFQSVYTWRTFFLIYSEEDYVEMARAKGLPDGTIERRYILRPTLPYILTNFLMLVVSLWQGTIALELLFGWPGLGFVFAIATRLINVPLLLGIVTIFAYMLAITVFLLDFSYALIDPRVRVALGHQNP
jgi:peptide/nickel transport system permease protein